MKLGKRQGMNSTVPSRKLLPVACINMSLYDDVLMAVLDRPVRVLPVRFI